MAGLQRTTSYASYLRPHSDTMSLSRTESAVASLFRIRWLRARPLSIYLRHGGKPDTPGLGDTVDGAHLAAGSRHEVIAEAD